MPAGPAVRSSARPARVHAECSALGERLVVHGELDGMSYVQVVTLFSGSARVELRTSLHGFCGQDRLVRLRFPVAVDGGTSLAEVANAVVARNFGFVDQDCAEAPWTLDSPAQGWAGVGATLSVELADGPATVASRALGVAEVVLPDDPDRSLVAGARSLLVALVQKGVTASCTEASGNRYGALLGDSNLPDVRVVIGRPRDNSFAAAVLAGAGAAYEDELEGQLAAKGSAALWVPSARRPVETWVPNADLRDARDLPVLLVAGRDAASTGRALVVLVEQVRAGHLKIDQPGALSCPPGPTGRPDAPDWTAAVLNRGTPGFAVGGDGAIYVSLLRSCTGWPSGVWIDPPRRTAPDGSNFQLEHWSHVFDHALVAGAGDWRSLGCAAEAQAFNTPLVAVVAGLGPGAVPPEGSFLELAGDSDRVLLCALKPVGHPLAGGEFPLEAAEGPEVALRLYESAGYPAHIKVRAGLGWQVEAAWSADLLEQREEPLPCPGGEMAVSLGPAQTRTLRLRLRGAPAAPAGPGAPPGPQAPVTEPAEPVFSRYWLHNKGTAPMGNQLLAVHLGPNSRRARIGTGPLHLVATVASSAVSEAQAVHLGMVPPAGWSAEPPSRILNLAPGAHASVPFELMPPPGVTSGRYFVAARAQDLAGQAQEDVATVDLLPRDPVAPYAPSLALGPAFGHPSAQVAAEMEAVLSTEAVRLHPGTGATVELVLVNRTHGELRGEAQLVSPVETWPFATPWSQGFIVSPNGRTNVPFAVQAPVTAEPMSSWLLIKVMYFGRLWYSPAVRLEIGP